MLPADGSADLQALADELAHPRIQWFHDDQRLAGRAVAEALGGADQVAWDVYLAFDGRAHWGNHIPRPRDWIHQLDAAWADPQRHPAQGMLESALVQLVETA